MKLRKQREQNKHKEKTNKDGHNTITKQGRKT